MTWGLSHRPSGGPLAREKGRKFALSYPPSEQVERTRGFYLANDLFLQVLKEAGEEMDATKLILDKNDEYLVFINKKDLSLWGLKL